MTVLRLGIDNLLSSTNFQQLLKGNIALLCHSASVDSELNHSAQILKKLFPKRFKKIFGPQHGFITDVQDNMIESSDFFHPYFQMTVHSLYSTTRIPTDLMLEEIDTVVVDLQDVGTRVYTYISTLALLMEKCATKKIKVVVLDRPNPVGGEIIEGNILEDEYKSFVGQYPFPQRHGMTIGEVATYKQKILGNDCELAVIPMDNYKRNMFWRDTNLHWINPSPNLSTQESAITFVGTVLFEGTNISEGRGTTRALEMVGFPGIEPFGFIEELTTIFDKANLTGFKLRPAHFFPMFQKHQGKSCGGFQIQITNQQTFRPWSVAQILCREFKKKLCSDFLWKAPPYEYELIKMPIDLINGSSANRLWVENYGDIKELELLNQKGHQTFLSDRQKVLIY